MAIPNMGSVKTLVDNVGTVVSERATGPMANSNVTFADQPVGDALNSNYLTQTTFKTAKQFVWGIGRWGNKTDVVTI